MKIITRIIFILSILTTGFFVKSQNVEFTKSIFHDKKGELRKAKKQIKKGDEYFQLGGIDYDNALECYLQANNFNPNNAALNLKIGKTYLCTNEKSKATEFLIKAIKLNETSLNEAHYYLGQAYQFSMKWDDAIKEYNLYKKNINQNGVANPNNNVDKKITECENGKILAKSPVKCFIDNFSSVVNSKYDDYFPVLTSDESTLLFTSRRKENNREKICRVDNKYFEDIFVTKMSNKLWSNAENYDNSSNAKDNSAVAGLSGDGKIMLIYDGSKHGDLYISEFYKDKRWTRPDRLSKEINSKRNHESSAAITPDGNTLYFVSNKKDGIGGSDIYLCTKDEKGRWTKPLNLGSTINTVYDEEFPFITADGKTLYFSSKGHNSMGGFDVFKSVNENGKWSEPKNLGFPVNTPCDDFTYFAFGNKTNFAYYSSNRENGIGGSDIYKITYITDKPVINSQEDNLIASIAQPVSEVMLEKPVEIREKSMIGLKGIVTDAADNKPIKAEIEITDNEQNKVISTIQADNKTGEYLVTIPSGKNFGVTVKADGYMFSSENVNIPLSYEYIEVKKDFALKKIEAGTKVVLNNIFFDFNKSTLRKASIPELDRVLKLLQDMPTLKIEISGHTDNKGNAKYNQKLSENRAKAVVDYLLNKGIDKSRLTSAGYGFTQPVAPNDNEKGRQLNRRTEFKVISK
ncbi:MAG: OmpA family protein [Bacteroidales bacterium]|jgi:outer membrane protein OmpA-like peptidoglycan-associated protein